MQNPNKTENARKFRSFSPQKSRFSLL